MRFRLDVTYDVYLYDKEGNMFCHFNEGWYSCKEDMLWEAREKAYEKRKDIGKIVVCPRQMDGYQVYSHTGRVIKE